MIRDRIRELRRVPASELRANPKNWRVHPPKQRSAMQAVLDSVGYADALLARELADGSLELLDGHLRAETTPDEVVPVLVVELDDAEAALVLATHDPLASMATTDLGLLEDLLGEMETSRAVVARMTLPEPPELNTEAVDRWDAEPVVPSMFHVVVECADEADQQTVYEQLRADGRTCRVVTL